MSLAMKPDSRERIISAAYELFSHRGIRAVGVDELIARSGVANATFYRHFRSKDELVLAFLDRREEVWTLGTIELQARERSDSPTEQLLAIFDVFDEWFHQVDFEGCSFVNVLLEMGANHPLGQASIAHIRNVRGMVRSMAQEANLHDIDQFVQSWHILMKGAIIAAMGGDREAATGAKRMAERVLEDHRGWHQSELVSSGSAFLDDLVD